MASIDDGRIKEADLVVPALRLANSQPGGHISTEELIAELTTIFNPTGKDAEIIPGRNDTHFSQKIRNLISHKGQPNNLIAQGLAEHQDNGLTITSAGQALLKQVGN